jgi:acyl transferase domain-containing protein
MVTTSQKSISYTDVAIIGMSGRFPGAQSIEEFWRNLRQGVESVSLIELGAGNANSGPNGSVGAVRREPGGRLEGADLFDASFFGISPREAEATDPQHRVFLECAWEALEIAGYAAESFPGSIGVFAGASPGWYGQRLYSDPALVKALGGMQLMIGNSEHFLATKVSYKLNLRGPSVVIQTACSTSLVAVHLACQSLLNGECDMALAGGVALPLLAFSLSDWESVSSEDGGIISSDGHCRAFDAAAQGTIPGEGAGIVVLRRLADAIRDGDAILAVIKGSAINNDGASKMGYTAPSGEGQANVISEAIAMSKVDPRTITYIEAHGTGTPIGDPIEIEALSRIFRGAKDTHKDKKFCAIGSVKTNIGHLDAAAGVAGLIKTVLALKHREIPASLHFTRPNPSIDFANSPFYVNCELRPWNPDCGPRRAGVNAFGFGGTNAHVVLEEAPALENSGRSRRWNLWVLSAKTKMALDRATANLANHLAANPEVNLSDAAYTLQTGRRAFGHRRVFVGQEREDVIAALESRDPGRCSTAVHDLRQRPVRFLFPGQGTQYVRMGRELYESESRFRQEIDRSSDVLLSDLGFDLRKLLYPEPDQVLEAESQLSQTSVTQPALFVVEYALAKLWEEWGVRPQAMIGHSIGEYVAACLAGVFSLEDALGLVAARGRLIQASSPGAMLAVPLGEGEVQQFLNAQLSLASVNGPSACVVSGFRQAIQQLKETLAQREIEGRVLATSHAFHSHMMDPVLPAFAAKISTIALCAPRVPYVSNVTGKWISPSEPVNPGYWVNHLRQTVRMAEGISELLNDPDTILLEVGPGRTMAGLVRQSAACSAERVVLSSLRQPREDRSDEEFILRSLGKVWLAGGSVDWQGFHKHENRHRVQLPTYPFERHRYWIEPASARTADVAAEAADVSKTPAGRQVEQSTLHVRPEMHVSFAAPRNDTEKTLSAIWQTMLGIREVGIHDNFFDLGGHSLLAIQMISRLRTAFSVEVSPETFFESQTIAALGQAIENLKARSKNPAAAPPISRIGRAASRGRVPAPHA